MKHKLRPYVLSIYFDDKLFETRTYATPEARAKMRKRFADYAGKPGQTANTTFKEKDPS